MVVFSIWLWGQSSCSVDVFSHSKITVLAISYLLLSHFSEVPVVYFIKMKQNKKIHTKTPTTPKSTKWKKSQNLNSKNLPLLTGYYPLISFATSFYLLFKVLSGFCEAEIYFKMFFPSISWPSLDNEADVQSSSSLPFPGVVLLLCLADLMLYADCLFIHCFIFQDVVAGFQLPSTLKLHCAETVSCWSLLHLLSQVANELGGFWENIR